MIRVVLTTFSDVAEAKRVIRMLIEEHLIACGTIVPGALSLYRWEGEIHQAEEMVILLKTTSTLVDTLERRLGELHSYENPEIISFSPDSISKAYAGWVVESTGDGLITDLE